MHGLHRPCAIVPKDVRDAYGTRNVITLNGVCEHRGKIIADDVAKADGEAMNNLLAQLVDQLIRQLPKRVWSASPRLASP